MFEMRLETLVNSLVESLIGNGNGRANEGLLFSFDVSLAVYAETADDCHTFQRRHGLHLFYQANPGQTYINVFSAVTPRPFYPAPRDAASWTHEVTHDSCWRSDVKAISDLYFRMAEEINAELESTGHSRIAPKDMSMHVYPGSLSDSLYRWVACHLEKDPADKHNHRRTLTLTGKATPDSESGDE